MPDTTLDARGAPVTGSAGGRRRSWLLAAAAVVVGAALATLLTAGDGPSTAPAPATTSSDALDRQVERLQERVEDAPDDADGWLLLGEQLLAVAEQDGDPVAWARAEDAFDEAARLAPDEPGVAVGRGALALSQHRFADALALGNAALEQVPGSPAALGVVVDAQVELGRYDTAAETLQQLLDTRPDLRALARASYLRELGGDLDGAVVAMQQAVTASGGVGHQAGVVEALLGDLLLRTGDPAAAGAAYQRALESAAGDLPQAQVGLARVDVAGEDLAAAEQRLAALVDGAPRLDALLLLGDVRRAAGDVEGAALADELVAASGALAEAGGQVVDLELALFEADHGSEQQAVSLATDAYEARRTVFTSMALASALVAVGEPGRAAPFADEALRLDTPHAELLVRGALVADAAGEPQVAAERLAAAFDLAPWFAVGLADDAVRLADDLRADGVVRDGVDAEAVEPPPEWSRLA